MKNKNKNIHSLIWIAVIILVVYVLFFNPTAIQQRNLAKANAHIPKVWALIDDKSPYYDLKFFAYTGKGGALGIIAYVRSENDKRELLDIVKKSNPPVPIHEIIKVDPLICDALEEKSHKDDSPSPPSSGK